MMTKSGGVVTTKNGYDCFTITGGDNDSNNLFSLFTGGGRLGSNDDNGDYEEAPNPHSGSTRDLLYDFFAKGESDALAQIIGKGNELANNMIASAKYNAATNEN